MASGVYRLMTNTLKQVEEFWNKNLCGKHFIDAEYPAEDFFKQYREFRYRKEHHLNYHIDWQTAKNKDVLEIGSGIGADGTRWAKYAKSYTAIDLTNEAVKSTKLHLKALGLKGNSLKGNAESLPFHGDAFDIIYSHGVLHHTPSIRRALRDIYRVLRRNGAVILMLYDKNSFNYWLRIQLLFRVRFFIALLMDTFGLRMSDPWKSHIKNFRNIGWEYFSWKNWHHHCTDGPDCQIANIYRKREIINLLREAGFSLQRMKKAHFPLGGIYIALERFLASYIGFYNFVWAIKK